MSMGALTAGRGTRYRYRTPQRALHWAMAAIIIMALALGLYCSYLPHGSSNREFLLSIHKSLGMTALCLIALRFPVRAAYGQPHWRHAPSKSIAFGSHVAHAILYLLMVLMPVSGYMTSGAEGRSIPWFGLFDWPNFMRRDQDFGRAMGTVHHYGAYAFFAILALHLAAVAWHRLVRRDEVLSRML